MFARLTFNRKDDKFLIRSVIGAPKDIWDLWYQLQYNSKEEGMEVRVFNLDGVEIKDNKGYADFVSRL